MTAEIEAPSGIRSIDTRKSAARAESTCRTCKNDMSRVKRGYLVKTFFSWLPLKRYACYNCLTKTYKWSRTK
ncbi:hypothetical protein [Mucilaginibacter pineti]|uniref:hypothetical protein n=1 Tax=Mucilaginibacter pineti TaxID=1391627 RepID=UPI00115FD2CB|nr:hypothetical protein [Mucilaginibacter pineti]